MSEEATLDEFRKDGDDERPEWVAQKLKNILAADEAGAWGDEPDGNGVSVLRATNFAPNKIDLGDVAQRDIPESKKESKRLKSGDIMVERSGGSPNQPVGRVLFYDLDGEHYPNNFLRLLRPETSQVNSRYLYYHLDYDYRKGETVPIQSNTTSIRNLQYGSYLNRDISLAPYNEQRKIATVLYTVDQAIQKTEEIIEQTHVAKAGLMQDAFHGRHKEFESYESTPVGEMPSHWAETNIGEIVHTAQYGISESLSEEGQYPTFRMNNIENGYMIGEPMKYVNLNDDDFEKYCVESGDILFNRTNSLKLVGKTGIYELEGNHVFASYLVRLQTNEQADPYYLNYYMNSTEGQNRMMDFATKGVSQANINANSIQQVKLPLPPIDEQREIAECIRGIDSQIESNQRCKAQLQRLKQGLMQDLLSGTVRTDDVDIAVLDDVLAHG